MDQESQEGFARYRVRWATGLCLALSLSCASSPWPDEPGVPVALTRAANFDIDDQFLTALTTARQTNSLPAPLVTPRYQEEISTFAEDLQAGRTSAAGAQRAIETWGRLTYRRRVTSWLVDCNRAPQIPATLSDLPAAVVSFAAAHFRPRSLPAEQCAVLVVAAIGPGDSGQADVSTPK